MAIETLKGIKEIGGFPVRTEREIMEIFDDAENPPNWHAWRSANPIIVSHSDSTISFKLQNKPIKEAGVNGCQVDTIIEAAKLILEGLNKNFPCKENELAINKLDMALSHLKERTKDREKRGVEGTSNE